MISKILPKIYRISDHSNSYIVEFEKHITIIDSGMDKKAKELIKIIESIGKKPKAVLITHAHIDHINGLAKLKEKYKDIEVVSSEKDKHIIENGKIPLPKGIGGFFFKIMLFFIGYKKVKVDKTFKNRYDDFKVIKTPGHTEGSVSLLFKKILFCGDLIINSKKIILPPNEFNLDEKKILNSIKKISKLDFNLILPGHGNFIKNGKKKLLLFLENSKNN
ncbi:MAG: MBL fold metallo-hydrolase [Candidatus Aenigmatarchaeota archaeon]